MLTSNANKVVAFNILDLNINLSDHLPIMAVCTTYNVESELVNEHRVPPEVTHLRWDHGPIDIYYEKSRSLLQPVLDDLDSIIEQHN